MSHKLIFFCQSASQEDPIVADTIQKIESLANRSEISHIFVLSLRGSVGKNTKKISFYDVGSNVSKFKKLYLLFSTVIKICREHKIKSCFLYMTPTILPFFWCMKPFFKFKVVAWFAHTYFNLKTRICLKYFCDKWVSIDKAQILNYPHVKIIGQGVDTFLFAPIIQNKKTDLLTVGRITPVKKIELIFQAMNLLNFKGLKTTLTIVGDAYLPDDQKYKNKLLKMIIELKLNEQVMWAGSIKRNSLPDFYSGAKVIVFPVRGGIGKVTVEALSCGIPVVINDPKAHEFLGEKLSNLFIASDDPELMASRIESLLLLNTSDYQNLSLECRQLILNKHSIEKFTERLSLQLTTN
jgi:glycosyltransferase involved in cell wall biosynthesis